MDSRLEHEGKFGNRNPLVQWCIQQFVKTLFELLPKREPYSILDVGCGTGELMRRLQTLTTLPDYVGYDLSSERINEAKRLSPDLEFRCADALSAELPRRPNQVILALEILEHLKQPEKLIQSLAELPSRLVILSVPHEPYFRMANFLRFRHLKTWGNHPEHIQHFTPGSLRKLAETALQDVTIRRSFPWLIAVGRTRNPSLDVR